MQTSISYTIEERENVKIVNMHGPLSVATETEYEALIDDITSNNNVIVNMSSVNLVTSSGLRAMVNVSANAKKKGKRVLLMGVPDESLKTIDIMDIYDQMLIVDSIEEGIRKLEYYI